MIYVDGFYEHHHFRNHAYPFYIYKKDHSPLILAGLFSEWTNPETRGKLTSFSIVTTTGNQLLTKIHNNPKLKEPRMPVILTEASADAWLCNKLEETDRQSIKSLIQPFPDHELEAYPIAKLRGKAYLGNVPEVCNPVKYTDLVF